MTDKPATSTVFSYDEHARSCHPTDFLGQTKRTLHGKPVPAEQIDMIIGQIQQVLELAPPDCLMEFACGNGHLSQRLFKDLQSYAGSDISEYLISVARQNFEQAPHFQFRQAGALEMMETEPEPERFNKLLCYAGIQYLGDAELVEILTLARNRFKNITRLFFGNIPNKNQATAFFQDRLPDEHEMASTRTALGRWRSPADMTDLARQAGWASRCLTMPTGFIGSNYRFDALLTPLK